MCLSGPGILLPKSPVAATSSKGEAKSSLRNRPGDSEKKDGFFSESQTRGDMNGAFLSDTER